jgi:light-regulated signal transduction histidine kinase (bacteriophytochrome)
MMKPQGQSTPARGRNIGQKKKANKEIQDELTSFTYVSSHDLQEPLRKIQTFSSRILEQEEKNLSASGKDYFQRVQQAVKRMQKIIEDLVIYSNINSATKTYVSTNLQEIIEKVKSEHKDLIAKKNASINFSGQTEIMAIPYQAHQLISNLVSNALKFSDGSKPTNISISSRIKKGKELNNTNLSAEKQYSHIKVSDNGIGFEPKFCERIFEVFQRLHGREEYEGTGIGLAICRKIVENHNGIITATGKLHIGASFDIYIPLLH